LHWGTYAVNTTESYGGHNLKRMCVSRLRLRGNRDRIPRKDSFRCMIPQLFLFVVHAWDLASWSLRRTLLYKIGVFVKFVLTPYNRDDKM